MPPPKLISVKDLPCEDLDSAGVGRLGAAYTTYLATKLDKNKRAVGIHASEISKCYRMAVYTMRGEEKRKEGAESERARWQRTFDQGTAIHTMLQEHFASMARDTGYKIRFESEVPIFPDAYDLAAKWNIHSSCDGIFTLYGRDPSSWKRVVQTRMGLEIKSACSNQFAQLKEPKPEHIEQIHVYMAILDLPIMWMLYFNKDNQNITPPTKPWLVAFDPQLWAKLELRFQSWHKHLADGTLPAAMPGSHCGFCPYTWTCNPPNRRSSAHTKPVPTSAGLRKLT